MAGYFLTMVALPNRDRKAERREATRREILDTAWEIARRDSLAAVTLREVAQRIGMRSPSLYTHFDSKNAIYDAMFAQAWTEFGAMFGAIELPAGDRAALLAVAEAFFDFATADLARHQLMNQRTIPGFRPSAVAYAASVAAYEQFRAAMAERGVRNQADLDLWTAILGGFVDQQLANEPGGIRWRCQLPRLVDMYCDEVGVSGPHLRRTR
ncbi:MAG TPA: TetR/AcrR family transcriptional regulator [Streptosporangiaceae bacterium]|jgi:AcrR family transcriptional regulator|nr:TetR/AcrR family transcriptional regulator [Streptosporangiaceae bacterium]